MTQTKWQANSLLTLVFQVISNRCSQPFVESKLATGEWSENDERVQIFRQTQANPLFRPMVKITHAAYDATRQLDNPTLFWFDWLNRAKADFALQDEMKLAAPFCVN